jgi:signal transduction histidine kinase
VSDDGAGPRGTAVPALTGAAGAPAGAAAQAGDGAAGSGLAGLAERAARLGGTLSAGAGERGGFWLRVSVPLTGPPPAGTVANLEPGRERMPS